MSIGDVEQVIAAVAPTRLRSARFIVGECKFSHHPSNDDHWGWGNSAPRRRQYGHSGTRQDLRAICGCVTTPDLAEGVNSSVFPTLASPTTRGGGIGDTLVLVHGTRDARMSIYRQTEHKEGLRVEGKK